MTGAISCKSNGGHTGGTTGRCQTRPETAGRSPLESTPFRAVQWVNLYPFPMGNCSSGSPSPKRSVIQVSVKASGGSDVAQRYAVGNKRVTTGISGGAGDDEITYGEVRVHCKRVL
jgi:hypothetical protein